MKNKLNPHAKLSNRQEQILEASALGYSVKETADLLFITESTVASHIRKIKELTGAQKSTEMSLVWFCRSQGLTINDLIKKRLLPVIICIGLSLFSIFNGSDVTRITRCSRNARGRRYDMENLLTLQVYE